MPGKIGGLYLEEERENRTEAEYGLPSSIDLGESAGKGQQYIANGQPGLAFQPIQILFLLATVIRGRTR